MANKICEILRKNGLHLRNIAFQSYDFASNMSVNVQGTQAMLQQLSICYLSLNGIKFTSYSSWSLQMKKIVAVPNYNTSFIQPPIL